MPVEDRSNYKKIQVWVPLPLWKELESLGYSSPTDAVLKGLNLLTANSQKIPMSFDDELRTRVEEKDARIKELQDQLKVKDDQIKVNDGHQNNRIEDLKNHIYLLDNQLRTKDDQIEKLNENMHKTAVHIQSLIQENSRLNTKLLPENTGNKKPWWKFW
jgi:uncharacterized phage infection (PIP) family protein YhgE